MVNKIVLSISIKFDINLQMLNYRGKLASKELSERCVSNIRSMGDVAQVINEQQYNLVIVLDQVRDEKILMKN